MPAESSGPVNRAIDRAGATGVVSRPALFERLRDAARVTLVSAPPGSGKTVLLRSWIAAEDLTERVAWVPIGTDERDPQRFWLSVLDALRQTALGASLVRELAPAPDLDGWAIVERLLEDLVPLNEPVWLVLDDLHELGSAVAVRQLELLAMRAPQELRFVLAARHDVQLGLHRLRLEGELTEIRAPDLRFTVTEARTFLQAAGVELTESSLRLLVARTEGWAAGLRLAALSLAGDPDPERFAAEFSGSERTVAEYLLAEVLDRQPEYVRRLLLRTSVVERVSGELASLLAGFSYGEKVLQDLEQANAFVESVDAARSVFRYHRMFADLLQLELRRTQPNEVAALHCTAADWFARNGYPVEAIRHAQVAEDWGLAAALLAHHWPGLYLDGQAATVHALLAGFPTGMVTADAELAVLSAADELAQGSLEGAQRYLGLAESGSASMPAARTGRALVLLGVVRLLVAQHLGNLAGVAEEMQRLESLAEIVEVARPGLGEELRALALISLGVADMWAAPIGSSRRNLEHGVALAHRIGRAYLEVRGLAHQAMAEVPRSFARAGELARNAISLARQHGWADDPAICYAYMALGTTLAWQGQPDAAEPWVRNAERAVRAEAEPVTALAVTYLRGLMELMRGRDAAAVAALQAGERLGERLAAPYPLVRRTRCLLLLALVRRGEAELAERVLADLGEQERAHGDVRIAIAAVRAAKGDPSGATDALVPVIDGSVPVLRSTWLVHAFMLQAIAQDALGDQAAARQNVERALDVAAADGTLGVFLLWPAPGLIARQVRQRAAHSAVIAQILDMLPGETPVREGGRRPLLDPLSKSETRVLGYLPTHLSAPEIARELSVSVTTVKAHMRNVYAKLGAHSRTEAVESARALGLLAPSVRQH